MNIYTYLQIDTDVIKFETDSYSVLSSKSKFKTCLKYFFLKHFILSGPDTACHSMCFSSGCKPQ